MSAGYKFSRTAKQLGGADSAYRHEGWVGNRYWFMRENGAAQKALPDSMPPTDVVSRAVFRGWRKKFAGAIEFSAPVEIGKPVVHFDLWRSPVRVGLDCCTPWHDAIDPSFALHVASCWPAARWRALAGGAFLRVDVRLNLLGVVLAVRGTPPDWSDLWPEAL